MIKVAFYDAKEYDKVSFEHYGEQHDIQFSFFETKLNEDTNSFSAISFDPRIILSPRTSER